MDAAENKALVRGGSQPTEALAQAQQQMEAQIELLRAQAGELKDAIKKTNDDQKEASMVALQSKMDTIMAKVDRDMQPPVDDIQAMAVKLVQAINSNAAGKLDERLAAIEAALSEIKHRIITVANSGDNSTLGRLDLKQTSGAQPATPSEPTGPGSKRKRVEDDVDVISLSYLEELTAERRGNLDWFRRVYSLGSRVIGRLVPCQDIPDWNPRLILESFHKILALDARGISTLAQFMNKPQRQQWYCVRNTATGMDHVDMLRIKDDGTCWWCKDIGECLQIAPLEENKRSEKYRVRLAQQAGEDIEPEAAVNASKV